MHHPVTLAFVAVFVIVAVCLLGVRLASAEPVEEMGTALSPASRLEQKWWEKRHEQKLAAKSKALENGDAIELVFVGDSITQGWEAAGKKLWAERFAPYGSLNLGFSGDRTEHVLWRLGLEPAADAESSELELSYTEDDSHNEVLGLTPKLIVVMIGSNNTGHRLDPPEVTAAGVTAIVERLRDECPDSHLLLLGVFPRSQQPDDKMRKINVGINARIAKLSARSGVTFLDISQAFLAEDGELPKSVMPDGLHPNKKGYQLWADAIRDEVEKHLGPIPAKP